MESPGRLNYARAIIQSPIGHTHCRAAAEFREIPDVTALDIDRILPAESFGGFTTLFASARNFIRAGKDRSDPQRETES